MEARGLWGALLCLMASALTPWQEGSAWAEAPFQIRCGQGIELLRLRPGNSPDNIGISTPREANPEGPMSFDWGEKGEIYILDQVNKRVQVFAGSSKLRGLPLPKEGLFMDLVVLPGGRLALLDNSFKKSIFILNKEGGLESVLPLEGRGIPLAEEISGIYVRTEGKLSGLWAELGGRSVLMADLEGRPDARRISVPGTLSTDGSRLLRAEKKGDSTVVVYRSEAERFSRWEEIPVSVQKYVESIWEVGEDKESRIYLVLGLLDERDKPEVMVMILDQQGKSFGNISLCTQEMPHEIHRPLRITSGGEIYQMGLDKRGFFLKKFTTPLSSKKSQNLTIHSQ